MSWFRDSLLGVRDERLSTRTARRYFKGDLVKEVSIHSVHTAVADALMRAGPGLASEDPAANEFLLTVVTKAVALNARWWDQLRVALHRRVGPLELRNLPALYTAFLRLAVVDLALRIGAHKHLTGQSDEAIRLREFVEENATGRYLNELRRNCDSPSLSLDRFSEAVEVDRHTVDRWLYKGERPTEENLQQVAKVLARSMSRGDAGQVLRSLRQVFLVSDALRAVAAIVGQQATDELATVLVSLASRTSEVLKSRRDSAAAIYQLALEGSNAMVAPRVTAELRPICSGEWATDLDWVCGRWVWRLHQVYLDIRDGEQAEVIEHSRGKLLEQWGVTHPEAYEHYQRSADLQARGLISEAIEEVRTAIRIDPHDPATHFTLGSVLAGIGNRSGNREWVEEGLRECWIAVELDRSWLLPNVEVGWILIESCRYEEARAHLESIVEPPSGYDANYYQAVGTACSASGDVVAALAAFERAMALDSSDAVSYLAASSCAFQLKDSKKGARYAKEAKRLGSTLAHNAWKAGLFTTQARHL